MTFNLPFDFSLDINNPLNDRRNITYAIINRDVIDKEQEKGCDLLSKLEYMVYFLYICITIVVGAAGAYYVVNIEDIKITALGKQNNNKPHEEKFKKYGQVVGVDSNLCIREAADINSEVNYVLYEGMTFDIVDKKNEWYYIKYDNNIIGYVNEAYVEEYDDVPPNKTYEEIEQSIVSEILKKTEKTINAELTAYCNCVICSESWGSKTAMQTQTRKGVVAAPKEIPLGSRLYIPELEYYKEDCIFDVEDRGGAVKVKDDGTYIIDIWLPNHAQVKEFGRKKAVVHIVQN